MTATFGGLIRDVVATETPLLLRREIYATAAAAGALVVALAHAVGLPPMLGAGAGLAVAFGTRGLGLVLGLSLPGPRGAAAGRRRGNAP